MLSEHKQLKNQKLGKTFAFNTIQRNFNHLMDDEIANITRVIFFKHEGAENNRQQFLSVKRIKKNCLSFSENSASPNGAFIKQLRSYT